MSDFSDIDGGEEPLFGEYEDEDLADPPPLPPPLAILNSTERDPGSLDDAGLGFDQPFDTSRNESHDQSSSAAPATKKRKPILTFNEGRLTSAKGLQAIVADFPKVKFKGKGHERSDLKLLINNYEDWANRLFPRLAFDDFIERAEKLGAKKEVKAVVNQLRNGTSVVDDEMILRDDDQLPTGVHQSSDTGTVADDQVDNNIDLPNDDVMLDYADDHGDDNIDDNSHDDNDHFDDHGNHGNDTEPANTVNASLSEEAAMVDEKEAMIDQGTSNGGASVSTLKTASGQDKSHLSSDDDCDQVKITDDHNSSLTIDSDKLEHNSINHNSNTSSDHECVFTVCKDVPDEHEGHSDTHVHSDDPPTDAMDNLTEEPSHNPADKLFNDISLDELFNDDV